MRKGTYKRTDEIKKKNKEFHNKYGQRNNTIEQLKEFLNNKL